MTRSGIERRFKFFRRTGDPAALAAVFDATASEVLRVAMHLARDPGAAEDLLQRTFLTAIESAAAFDGTRRVLPWLLGILSNHAHEAARRAARTPDPERLLQRETESPEAAAAAREALEAAGVALDALPDPARSILSPALVSFFYVQCGAVLNGHGFEAKSIGREERRPKCSRRRPEIFHWPRG